MAEDIHKQFREHSIAEFFKKNRQMLGFSGKVKSLTTLVHEFVTNSLDACEEAGILPDVSVQIEQLPDGHLRLTVEDNGPGIPKKIVGKALGQMLAGTKFHRLMQQRGQQGIGASGGIMYAQITTGKPTYFKTGMGDGTSYEGDLKIDFKTNSPVIENDRDLAEVYRGLKVSAVFGDVKYERSESSPFGYMKRTALANPHAQLLLVEPSGERVLFPRASDLIPLRPREVQPHPLGVTANDLMEYAAASKERKLSQFFTGTFSRFSPGKVAEVRDEWAKLLCEKGMNIAEASSKADDAIDGAPKALRWEDAEQLIEVFRRLKWIAPETDAIRPVGPDQIDKAMRSVFNPEFISVTERKPKVFRGGIPFAVEAALAYGGSAGERRADGSVAGSIMRFANRVPLLFDAGGCAITLAVKGLDWKRYDIKDFEHEPVSVFVNVVSVHVPYTGAGKQALSEEEEVMEEIRLAVMDAARDMQRYLHGKIRDHTLATKKKAVLRYVEQLAHDIPALAGKGDPKELRKKLLAMVEEKYSQMTLDDAQDAADADGNGAKDEKPEKNGNGEGEE